MRTLAPLFVLAVVLPGFSEAESSFQSFLVEPMPENMPLRDYVRAVRQPYSGDRWRCSMSFDESTGDGGIGFRYRAWRNAGVGFAFENDGVLDERPGTVSHNLLALSGWAELPEGLSPASLGVAFAAGPMYSEVMGRVDGEPSPVASGWGGGMTLTFYMVVPVVSLVAVGRQRSYWPYVTAERFCALGWSGNLRGTANADLNGDGQFDVRKGEVYQRLTVFWQSLRWGLMWIF